MNKSEIDRPFFMYCLAIDLVKSTLSGLKLTSNKIRKYLYEFIKTSL